MKIRAADIQAALTVLGRRIEVPGEIIELQSTDLRACYLGELNLRGSILGRAMVAYSDFTDADLSGSWLRRTNFHKTVLIRCNLQNAVLRDAILLESDLSGANLRGTDFSNADLTLANLEGTSFDQATIWPHGFNPPTQ